MLPAGVSRENKVRTEKSSALISSMIYGFFVKFPLKEKTITSLASARLMSCGWFIFQQRDLIHWGKLCCPLGGLHQGSNGTSFLIIKEGCASFVHDNTLIKSWLYRNTYFLPAQASGSVCIYIAVDKGGSSLFSKPTLGRGSVCTEHVLMGEVMAVGKSHLLGK